MGGHLEGGRASGGPKGQADWVAAAVTAMRVTAQQGQAVQVVVVPLAVVQVWPPLEVTVYLVSADPLEAAAVQDTTDWLLANEVAATFDGAPGTVLAGTTALEAPDAALVPAALVAVTLNV